MVVRPPMESLVPKASPSRTLALRFISGKYQGGEFPLGTQHEIIVGRSSELDMVLVEDMVSRRHARIECGDDQIVIEDLGSTNGTFVNGEPLGQAPRVLNGGDQIEIGGTMLLIEVSAPSTVIAPVPAPPMQAEPPPPPPPPPPAAPPPPGQPPAPAWAPPTPTEQDAVAETEMGRTPVPFPPQPPATAEEQRPVPPLSLRVDVDFAAREARLELGDAAEPIRLVLEDGRWRVAP